MRPPLLQRIGEIQRLEQWGAKDSDIFFAWREKSGLMGHMAYINYRIYDPHDMPPNLDEMTKKCWLALCQKRIDLLIFDETSLTPYEFRWDANPDAIGRLLLYMQLLQSNKGALNVGAGILVSNRITPDLIRLSSNYGIKRIEVKIQKQK